MGKVEWVKSWKSDFLHPLPHDFLIADIQKFLYPQSRTTVSAETKHQIQNDRFIGFPSPEFSSLTPPPDYNSPINTKGLKQTRQETNTGKVRQIRSHQNKFQKRKSTVNHHAKFMIHRTNKLITKTVTSIPGEVIPVNGTVVVAEGLLMRFILLERVRKTYSSSRRR